MLKRRSIIAAFMVASLSLAVAYWAQPSFLYLQRRYSVEDEVQFTEFIRIKGFALHKLRYSTGSNGTQVSYLIVNRAGENSSNHCHLILLLGGNGMTAFDWGEWIGDIRLYLSSFPRIAFLLVDYPGYGANDGSPSPESMHEAVTYSLESAIGQLKTWGFSPIELNVVGHSIGSAVAAKFVDNYNSHNSLPVTRLILSAPFTSIVDMVPIVFPIIPLGVASIISRHNWDTRTSLKRIVKENKADLIFVVHGNRDQIVPFRMGEELANLSQSKIRLVPVKTASHNDVLSLVKLYGLLLSETRADSMNTD